MTDAEKLTALREIDGIEVVELVKVSWPVPDGEIYYVSTLDEHLFRGFPISDVNLDQRLAGRKFQEILSDTTIADDQVQLRLWDGDGVISDLANAHGSGQRVELFYWFPQVELLSSQWFGRMQPATEAGIDWYQCTASVGFMSSMLTMPRRAFYTGCQALFGGLLKTQAEIDEGDCPYNRHLTAASLIGFDPSGAANVNAAGGMILKNGGGVAWNAGARHSRAVQAGEDAVIEVVRGAPYAIAGFTATDSPRADADFLVGLQWNPDGSVTIQYNYGASQRANAATSISGDRLRVELRSGRFRFYKGPAEIVPSGFNAPAPTFPLFLSVAIFNEGSGVTAISVAVGDIGSAPGFGNIDPATNQPFTECPRNRAACIVRLGDDLSYLGFDTVIQSYTVNQTKGPNISVTTRGNESNLKRPLRVIIGERDVSDIDLLAYTVEPDTKHPEGGAVSVLGAECEGPIQEQTNQAVNGVVIGAMHLNARNGDPRQARTGFSPQVANYSSTALFFGRAQGDFTQTTADQLRLTAHVKGLRNIRRYTDPVNFIEEYSTDRAWALLHCLRNKRWGYGLDVVRFVIQDWIDLAAWGQQIVSFTDADGTHYTSQRTSFHAELIDRSVQQQINDICLAGRFSLPYVDEGRLRIKPLASAAHLFTPLQFTDKAFLAALARLPTTSERNDWTSALSSASESSASALLAEAQSRVRSLFDAAEYLGRHRTNSDFVSDLYAGYYGRVADPAALPLVESLNSGALTAAQVEDQFAGSQEFAYRVAGLMGDAGLSYFCDFGEARNICVDDAQKSTLVRQIVSDAEVSNRVVVTFDDAAHGNAERPLTFEDIDAQLRAGYAFGDTSRRAVEKTYAALGVTDVGEAVRLGNILLYLGAFDEGGTINNLRIQFTTWFSEALSLRKYDVIKVESRSLDRYGFKYFRIRSLRRMPDLKVEISAQAYPEEFYDLMESWTQPPPIIGTGGQDNPGGDPRLPPGKLGILDTSFDSDRITFQIAEVP